MTGQSIETLMERLAELYRLRFEQVGEQKGLRDRRGRPMLGHEKDEQRLNDAISKTDSDIKALLTTWVSDSQVNTRKLISDPVQVEISVELLMNTLELDYKKQVPRVSVPPGQTYVLSRGFGMFDQDSFPEVYLAGEIIEQSRHRKDVPAFVIQLYEYPGTIRSTIHQWLAGISVSGEDVGTANFNLPLYLHDPIQTVRRAGKILSQPNGRQQVDAELVEQLTNRIRDVFTDRIQIWSAEKATVLERLSESLASDLREWGLRLKPEVDSLVRHYPHNLYEVVFQFAKAEREILDDTIIDEKSTVLKDALFSLDDIVFIKSTAKQDDVNGSGLFLKLREKKLSGNPQIREKVVNWLSTVAGSVAAEFVNSLYSGKYSETETSLSEQVVLASIRNPMLALGEYLETHR